MSRPAVVAALVLLSVAVTVLAQTPMRPGRWEVTMQMEMASMPMKMPPIKTTQCVTPEQVKDPGKAMPSGPGQNPNNCKVSDYKTTGNSVAWKIACEGPDAMSGTGEMKFDGDSSYTGVMTMTSGRGNMTMKYSGTRLGECTP
jgi:hypothetical protein